MSRENCGKFEHDSDTLRTYTHNAFYVLPNRRTNTLQLFFECMCTYCTFPYIYRQCPFLHLFYRFIWFCFCFGLSLLWTCRGSVIADAEKIHKKNNTNIIKTVPSCWCLCISISHTWLYIYCWVAMYICAVYRDGFN